MRWSHNALAHAHAISSMTTGRLEEPTIDGVRCVPGDRHVLNAATIAAMSPAERDRWSEVLGAEVLAVIAEAQTKVQGHGVYSVSTGRW